MKTSIYVETSIPSFYYDDRSEPDRLARRDWTREWWDGHVSDYDAYASEAVIEELERGSFAGKQDALALMDSLPLLEINEPIADIVATYISHRVMPNDPVGDALHLAVASFHKCDFLVTWNCRHLANANKFGHIRRINTLLGLYIPSIVTPLELLGDTQ
jgi:predicted nucleic acid-binding protein